MQQIFHLQILPYLIQYCRGDIWSKAALRLIWIWDTIHRSGAFTLSPHIDSPMHNPSSSPISSPPPNLVLSHDGERAQCVSCVLYPNSLFHSKLAAVRKEWLTVRKKEVRLQRDGDIYWGMQGCWNKLPLNQLKWDGRGTVQGMAQFS